MVKPENNRVIVTLGLRPQINLTYLEKQTGLKKSAIISLAINYFAELLRKEKR